MKIKEAFFFADGTSEIRELEISEEENQAMEQSNPQADTDALLVELAYRLTLLELGLTE